MTYLIHVQQGLVFSSVEHFIPDIAFAETCCDLDSVRDHLCTSAPADLAEISPAKCLHYHVINTVCK